MFSENHKISDRQLQSLLLIDWMGKLLLIQPGLTGGYSGGSVLLGTFVGLAAAAAALFFLMRSSGFVRIDYYSYVKKHAGEGRAKLLYLLYGIYFLEQTVLLLFLCGEIGKTYLLPERERVWLLLLPAVVGYFLARGGLEVRGRVSEILAWFLAVILLVMLLVSMGGISKPNLRAASFLEQEGVLESFYDTMTGFGSMLALPLMISGIEQRKGWKKKQYLAFGTGAFFLLLVYIAGYGRFGQKGMERLFWPILPLTSSLSGWGMFLQRWDVLLTAMLLLCLFLSVGSDLFYMETVLGTLAGKQENKNWRQNSRMVLLILSVLLALGIQDWEQALFFYKRISLWFCVPLLAVLVFSVKLRKRKKKLLGFAAMLLLAGSLLTGCTARELEERRFALVLEVDAADGQLIFGCAWPNVKDEDGKLTQNLSDDGNEENEAQKDGETQKEEAEAEGRESEEIEEAEAEGRENEGTKKSAQEETGEKFDDFNGMNTAEITRVSGDTLEEALEKVQNLQEKYVDYSQVKVILWGRGMEEEVQLEQEVLRWLEKNPLFSSDILVFEGEREDLTLELIQEHAQGQPGEYLEKLYENNRSFQKHTQRLYEFLYNPIDKKITP